MVDPVGPVRHVGGHAVAELHLELIPSLVFVVVHPRIPRSLPLELGPKLEMVDRVHQRWCYGVEPDERLVPLLGSPPAGVPLGDSLLGVLGSPRGPELLAH